LNDLRGKLLPLFKGEVHLPVAGYDFLSHGWNREIRFEKT
jgi:hypothetical protein